MMRGPIFADPPVVCGHRGLGRGIVEGHRENTLESFCAAVEAGAGWVEVDARVTADGELVAHHDPVAPDGRFISELPAGETDGLGLMRVAALFEALPEGVAVDVDLKSSLEDALRPRERTTAALVADLVARAGDRRVLVTSFDPAALLIVRERAPELPLGLITWIAFPLRKAVAAAAHLGVEVVAPHAGSFGLHDERLRALERPFGESIRTAHAAGLEVAVWGPQPEEADELAAAGVDCLVVDDVRAAVARNVPS